MRLRLIFALVGLLLSLPAQAQDIDLSCPELAKQMIERLSAEELMVPGGQVRERAQAISHELCSGAQATAQEQFEQGKREALDNWFMESSGGKAGNKRLKNFKR